MKNLNIHYTTTSFPRENKHNKVDALVNKIAEVPIEVKLVDTQQ